MVAEFEEVQKFTQWWLWLFLIVAGMLPIISTNWMWLHEKNSIDYTGLLISGFISLGIIIFFGSVKLKTKINQDGI